MKRLLFSICVLSLTAGCAADRRTAVPVTDGIPVTYRLPKDLEYGYKGIDFNQYVSGHSTERVRGTEIMDNEDNTLTVRRGDGHYSPNNQDRFLGSYTDYLVSVSVKDMGAFNEILFMPTQKNTQENNVHAVPTFTTKEVVDSLVWSTVRFKTEFTSEFNLDSVINNFNRKLKISGSSSKDKNNVYKATYLAEVDGITANCEAVISPYRNGSLIKLTLVMPLKSENGGKLVDVPPQIERLKKHLASVVAD